MSKHVELNMVSNKSKLKSIMLVQLRSCRAFIQNTTKYLANKVSDTGRKNLVSNLHVCPPPNKCKKITL